MKVIYSLIVLFAAAATVSADMPLMSDNPLDYYDDMFVEVSHPKAETQEQPVAQHNLAQASEHGTYRSESHSTITKKLVKSVKNQ